MNNMDNLNPFNVRFFSKLGQRGSFGMIMGEIAAQDEELVIMTADLATLTGLTRFKEKYPEQFINAGIAEQNMVGVAAGWQKRGKMFSLQHMRTFLQCVPMNRFAFSLDI